MDPVRGSNEDLSELEQRLLEAARSDRAPDALATHMARALYGGAAVAIGGACAAALGGNATASSGGVAASSGGVAASSGGVAASSGGVAASSGGVAASSGGVAASSGGVAASSGGVAASSGGVAASSGGVAATSGGVAASSGGAVSSGASTAVSDSVAASSGRVAASLGADAAAGSVAAGGAAAAASQGGKLVVPFFAKASLWGVLSIGVVLAGAAGWRLSAEPRTASQVQAPPEPATSAVLPARSQPIPEPRVDQVPAEDSASASPQSHGIAEPVAPTRSRELTSGATTERRHAAASRDRDPLLEEVALLGRARSALQRRNSARALRLLDQHKKRFERGTLTPEAVVLRIEALVQQGDYRQAQMSSEQFVKEYPAHPLRARAAAMVGSGTAR